MVGTLQGWFFVVRFPQGLGEFSQGMEGTNTNDLSRGFCTLHIGFRGPNPTISHMIPESSPFLSLWSAKVYLPFFSSPWKKSVQNFPYAPWELECLHILPSYTVDLSQMQVYIYIYQSYGFLSVLKSMEYI